MPCSNAPSKPSHPKSKPCTAPGTNTTKPEQTKSSRSQQASSSKPPCHISRPRSENKSPPTYRSGWCLPTRPKWRCGYEIRPPVSPRKDRSNEETTHPQVPAEPHDH